MKRFCTSCGKEMEEGAVFCTSCGAKNTIAGPVSGPASYPRPYMQTPAPASYPRPHKRKVVVPIVILAVVLALLGVGVWKAGEMTGLWQRMSVEREFNSWKKQKDLKSEQKEIFEVIESMQAELQAGNLAGAMAFVHPDRREYLGNIFNTHQDKLPLLISLMNDRELTYLSTDTGNYETLRMAIVQIGIQAAGTSAGTPDSGTAKVMMVKSEDGWVVEDIS